MYLFDEKEGMDWKDVSCKSSWVLEFSSDKDDYFLNFRPVWKEYTGQIFTFDTGKEKVDVPTGFWLMIGDVYGAIDWVMVDELIGRPLEAVVMASSLNQWSLRTLTLVDMYEDTIYWPQTKNVLPVGRNDSVLMLSDKDAHHKTKDFLITSFMLTT